MTDREIWGYDLETYKHVFTATFINMATGATHVFEVSRRRNDAAAFVSFVLMLRDQNARMLGFNNEGFDYPVVHHLINVFFITGSFIALDAWEKAQAIFAGDRFSHIVWPRERHVEQIDIFKIMHFDRQFTSLKKLEMNMRSDNVIDLPFPPDQDLTDEQIDILIAYNIHDVRETLKFAALIWDRIEFRDALGPEWVNYNDTKIGKHTFINALEKAGVPCFTHASGRKQPIQTPRTEGIRVGDQLIPIPFETPDLQRVWQQFKDLYVYPSQTKGVLEANAKLGPFEMHFGVGGIHGSMSSTMVRSRPGVAKLIDVDVTSYYPSLAIQWNFYPQHLGPKFVDVYRDLKAERVTHPKKSAENQMLKLALNGVYGMSNEKHGPFYDPAYMLAITTNGQLLLAWLAELLWLRVPGIRLIQINTDGVTVELPQGNSYTDPFDEVLLLWQEASRMQLEDVEYEWMAIRDVNNYIAQPVDGPRKRKGAYDTFEDEKDHLRWWKNHTALVIQKAVDAALDGADLAEFVWNHDNPFDFMCHVKVPRTSRLMHGDVAVQGTGRYYIAIEGERLTKVMPPLAGKVEERHISVNEGWDIELCNDVRDFNWSNLARIWYYREAQKLLTNLGVEQ